MHRTTNDAPVSSSASGNRNCHFFTHILLMSPVEGASAGWPGVEVHLSDESTVCQHNPGGALLRKWRVDDVNSFESDRVGLRHANLGPWMFMEWLRRANRWIVPRHDLRLSAGVPLKNIKPLVVVPSHLGQILLVETKYAFSFVTLVSFVDGLLAVRRRFERKSEEGRRTAMTAEERVANLRKCRAEMNDYSDRVVSEHMKVLPVEWKGPWFAHDPEFQTVLRLTTPDGTPVDDTVEKETNVVMLCRSRTDYSELRVRVAQGGKIQAKLGNLSWKKWVTIVPYNSSEAFLQRHPGRVSRIRYVRAPDSNTDSIQVSKELEELNHFRMLPIEQASGRWLLLWSADFKVTYIYDNNIARIAYLATPPFPRCAVETDKGLWVSGGLCNRAWVRLFKVDALQALRHMNPSAVYRPHSKLRRRPVPLRRSDKGLGKEAFDGRCAEGRWKRRRDRHPGHYWVVAGWGPVPTRLKAPEHIYKKLEFQWELEKRCRHFPLWSGTALNQPWLVTEDSEVSLCARWSGAVDVRDGVTAESIREDPKINAWSYVALGSGEFRMTGKVMSITSRMQQIEVAVVAGRWLWTLEKNEEERLAFLTLRHESVADVDVKEHKWNDTSLLDVEKLERRMMALEPLIQDEALRFKISEYSESVHVKLNHDDAEHRFGNSFTLMDKDQLSYGWEFECVFDRMGGDVNGVVRAMPMTWGVVVHSRCCKAMLRASKKMIQVACRDATQLSPYPSREPMVDVFNMQP